MWQTDDEDPNAVQTAIDDWFVKNDPQGTSNLLTSEELAASTSTGIPAGEVMTEPTPAVPAPTVVKNEHERAVHPDYCGAKYDELYGTTVKNIQKVMQQWPAKKLAHEVEIEKGKKHPMCMGSEPLTQAETLVTTASTEYAEIAKANKEIAIHGRHYYSKQQLEEITERCASVWQYNKALEDYMKAIKAIVAIPVKKKRLNQPLQVTPERGSYHTTTDGQFVVSAAVSTGSIRHVEQKKEKHTKTSSRCCLADRRNQSRGKFAGCHYLYICICI